MGPSVYLSSRQRIAMWSLVLAIHCAILGRMLFRATTIHPLATPDQGSITPRKPFLGGRELTAKSSIEIKAALFLVRSRIRGNPTVPNHSAGTVREG